MERKTKIVATLGPATDDPATLAKLIDAGVNVVRLNFSHGTADEHRKRAEAVRAAAAETGRSVGVLADLQGPKIRIESFRDGAVDLVGGQPFTLDTRMEADAGTAESVGMYYEAMLKDLRPGHELLLNDGAIALEVNEVTDHRIVCTVKVGGHLSGRKGVNLRGGGLSASGLTEKDIDDISVVAAIEADFVAVSFVQDADDLMRARQLLEDAGSHAHLCAKIERAEALKTLDEVIAASDAVMVARGDLGVEIGDAALPAVQKRIISRAREMNRLVITATQMMESMITSPIPTRAEVLDVANATLDGTDAVMLSAESAVGAHPVTTVETMARICEGAERGDTVVRSPRRLASHFQRTDEAIAMATIYTASNMLADAIISLTESGMTALLMSRQGTSIPIFALTQYPATERFLALCRGVHPVAFTPSELIGRTPIVEAIECLKNNGAVSSGQRVLVTKGDFTGAGGTNAMQIVTVD